MPYPEKDDSADVCRQISLRLGRKAVCWNLDFILFFDDVDPFDLLPVLITPAPFPRSVIYFFPPVNLIVFLALNTALATELRSC